MALRPGFLLRFVYFLPRGLALQDDLAPNSDNEVEENDGILELDDLENVILTHVRGAGSKGAAGDDGQESEEEKSSMDMFHRSNAIWRAPDRLSKADPAATKVYTEMQAAPLVRDHALAQQAAKTSATEGEKGQNTHRTPRDAEGCVRSLPPLTKQILEEFLQGDRVRKSTNQKQREFLELVVDRIMVELGLISNERGVEEEVRRALALVAAWSSGHWTITCLALCEGALLHDGLHIWFGF